MDHQTQEDMAHVKAEATSVASPTHDDDYTPQDSQLNSQADNSSQPNKPKRAGRRKINIEFIKDKSRRHITFSKRKAGIMKKAYELSTLTGTQVLLLVASETGHVYTFATPKLQPLITKTEGKNLIQACLNAPDMQGGGGDAQGMGPDDQGMPQGGLDYEGGLDDDQPEPKQKMKGNTMNMTAYAPPQQSMSQMPAQSTAQSAQSIHQQQQQQYPQQQTQQYQYPPHHSSHQQQLPSMQNHSSPHHFNQQQGIESMPQQYQQSHYQNAGYNQNYPGSNLTDGGVTSIPNLRVIESNNTPQQANYMTQFSQSNQY
jgi:hypothetical protein